MRDLVAGEEDVRGLDELGAQQVAEGVVFFVEGEEGGVGDAWGVGDMSAWSGDVGCRGWEGLTRLRLDLDLLLAFVEEEELRPVLRVNIRLDHGAHVPVGARILVDSMERLVAVHAERIFAACSLPLAHVSILAPRHAGQVYADQGMLATFVSVLLKRVVCR